MRERPVNALPSWDAEVSAWETMLNQRRDVIEAIRDVAKAEAHLGEQQTALQTERDQFAAQCLLYDLARKRYVKDHPDAKHLLKTDPWWESVDGL